MEIEPLPPHKGCFGCGPDNLAGLQLRLVREDSLTKAEFLPTQDYAGYEGLVHGGIVSLLFDEVMGTAAGYGKDLPCMSAELTIRYVQPLPIDKKYILIGEVTADKHRLWLTRGEIRGEKGHLYAWATGKYLPLNKRKQKSLEEQLQIKLK